MSELTSDQCGCGRPGRYMHFDKDRNEAHACNKYSRCLTHDEQREKLTALTSDMLLYRNALHRIVTVNAMDYEYKAWAKEALEYLAEPPEAKDEHTPKPI